MKIRWLTALKGFMCDSCNFKSNSFSDGKPMEFDKGRRDVMTTFNGWNDKAS